MFQGQPSSPQALDGNVNRFRGQPSSPQALDGNVVCLGQGPSSGYGQLCRWRPDMPFRAGGLARPFFVAIGSFDVTRTQFDVNLDVGTGFEG